MAALPPVNVNVAGATQIASGDVSLQTPNGATIQIAPADAQRTSIIMAMASAGNCWVGPINAVANGVGANLSLCGGIIGLSAKEYPDIVGRAWFAFAPVGVNLTVVTASITGARQVNP